MAFIFDAENGRLQRVDVKLNAAFQVGGFILVDHIRFGEFVQHGGHLRKQRYGGILLSRIAQRLYGITGRFVIIFIPGVFHLGLAYSFLR